MTMIRRNSLVIVEKKIKNSTFFKNKIATWQMTHFGMGRNICIDDSFWEAYSKFGLKLKNIRNLAMSSLCKIITLTLLPFHLLPFRSRYFFFHSSFVMFSSSSFFRHLLCLSLVVPERRFSEMSLYFLFFFYFHFQWY